MDIYGFNAVGSVHHKDSPELPKQDATIHKHENGDLLAKFSLTSEGVLLYDGKPIGGGSSFENEEVLQLFSVDEATGELKFDTDKLQIQLDNLDVVSKFSADEEGNLLYDSTRIQYLLDNLEVLAKLAENSKGKLTYAGGTISGGSADLAVNVAGRIDEAITARILLVRETTLPALLAGSKVMCLTPPTTPFEIRLSYYNQGVSTEFAVVTVGTNGQGVFSNLPQAPIVLPEGAFISVPASGMVGNGQDLLVALKTGD